MILNIIFLFPDNTPFLFKHVYPNVLNKRITFPTSMASIVMAILKATVGKLLDKGLSPPQRLPLGIPIKISIIDKNRKRAGDDKEASAEERGQRTKNGGGQT